MHIRNSSSPKSKNRLDKRSMNQPPVPPPQGQPQPPVPPPQGQPQPPVPPPQAPPAHTIPVWVQHQTGPEGEWEKIVDETFSDPRYYVQGMPAGPIGLSGLQDTVTCYECSYCPQLLPRRSTPHNCPNPLAPPCNRAVPDYDLFKWTRSIREVDLLHVKTATGTHLGRPI